MRVLTLSSLGRSLRAATKGERADERFGVAKIEPAKLEVCVRRRLEDLLASCFERLFRARGDVD